MAKGRNVSLENAKARYGDGLSSRSETVSKIRSAKGLKPLSKGSAPGAPVTPV